MPPLLRRCFAELIKMYQNKGQQGVQYIDYLFNNLDVVLNRYTDRFRETALITAGLIAKCVSLLVSI